ncbi:MAG: GyrI-like domain-containing protein [Caldilineaceae bacterium]
MKKIDFKQELNALYKASAKEVVLVEAPPLNYLMIDGEGDPNQSAEYADAVEALFGVAYAAKFLVKRGELAIDYGVMPLEGLWWADDMTQFSVEDKSNWKWMMMIMQPEIVTAAIIEEAMTSVQKKKGLPALSKMRFKPMTEGLCAQILHIGPFSEEGPTIERVHEFIDARGRKTGKHHEIYLSDIRRAAPEKWRTIIRQPLELASHVQEKGD